LLTRLLKKQGIAPKRMITDKLRSYGAVKREVMPHAGRVPFGNHASEANHPLP
jgi:putative transposase